MRCVTSRSKVQAALLPLLSLSALAGGAGQPVSARQTVSVQGQPYSFAVGTPAEIRFTNSVTHRPVTIAFRVGAGEFTGFKMTTDADTEGYYTGGEYRINDRLKSEHPRSLNYCSQVGMQLRLGEQLWKIKDTCLTLTIP